MKKTLATGLLSISLLMSMGGTQAAQLDIEITNLTRGSWFTPFLVTAHPEGVQLFSPGSQASESLQVMAEGGAISSLAADVAALNATTVEDPAGGLLAPGETTIAVLDTDDAPDNTRLSIVAMLLPSNDGFMGLNAVEIPSEPGTYVYHVNAYDAGTEANDEIIGGGAPGEAGFPAPPPVAAESGTGGTGIAATAEGFVHVHRNVLGDTDIEGGASDMVSTVHRWLNPVVLVVVTVGN